MKHSKEYEDRIKCRNNYNYNLKCGQFYNIYLIKIHKRTLIKFHNDAYIHSFKAQT